MRETMKTILAWLAVIGGAALAVFMLWLTLWIGYDLGFKM